MVGVMGLLYGTEVNLWRSCLERRMGPYGTKKANIYNIYAYIRIHICIYSCIHLYDIHKYDICIQFSMYLYIYHICHICKYTFEYEYIHITQHITIRKDISVRK